MRRASLLPRQVARLLRLPRRVVLAVLLMLVLYASFGPGYRPLASQLSSSSSWAANTAGRGQARGPSPFRTELEPRSDGTVLVHPRAEWSASEAATHADEGHPIRRLMADARAQWEEMLARQSTTFAQAVTNYRRRYGRAPPRGFEAWWAFVRANDVKIVDDYDEVSRTIEPFLALRPGVLATRLHRVLYSEPFSYALSIRRSAPIELSGERSPYKRPRLLTELFEGFRHALPADFGEGKGILGQGGRAGDQGTVVMGVLDHDMGSHIMGDAFRARMTALARAGQYIDDDELAVFEDRDACGLDSPAAKALRSTHDIILQPTDGKSKRKAGETAPIAFLRDVEKSYDLCHNPDLLSLHGTYSRAFARDTSLLPQFVYSKHAQGNQLLVTPLEGDFDNTTHRTPWEEKTTNKVFWRGRSTGDSFSARTDGYDWRASHRVRLHTLTRSREGEADVLVESPSPRGGSTLHLKRYDLGDLNSHLMDVGLAGIIQCNQEDGTCAAMRSELRMAPLVKPGDALHYKVALDTDGNAWSSRFRRLLGSGSVVFKSTIFPEFNTQWLKPWVHYVPVSIDLTSDLYQISTFFLGTPDGLEGHDDLAREIADAAARFTDEHWRWVDMQAYMFRLLLEYRRMIATDRHAMSLDGHFW